MVLHRDHQSVLSKGNIWTRLQWWEFTDTPPSAPVFFPPCFILISGLPMLLWKQVACVIQVLHFSNAVPSRQIYKTSTCKQSISNLRLLCSPNCHSEINVGVCASCPKHELCHEQCYTWHLKGSLTKQFTMHLWHTSYYTDIALKWGSLRCEMRSQGQYRVGGHICNLSAVFERLLSNQINMDNDYLATTYRSATHEEKRCNTNLWFHTLPIFYWLCHRTFKERCFYI